MASRRTLQPTPLQWTWAVHSKTFPKLLSSTYYDLYRQHQSLHDFLCVRYLVEAALFGRSGPAVDMIPTLKTRNTRICVLLGQKDQRMGMLTLHDAERLQVWHSRYSALPVASNVLKR